MTVHCEVCDHVIQKKSRYLTSWSSSGAITRRGVHRRCVISTCIVAESTWESFSWNQYPSNRTTFVDNDLFCGHTCSKSPLLLRRKSVCWEVASAIATSSTVQLSTSTIRKSSVVIYTDLSSPGADQTYQAPPSQRWRIVGGDDKFWVPYIATFNCSRYFRYWHCCQLEPDWRQR